MPLNRDPKETIIRVLKEHPEGLTFTSVARFTGMHRHTTTKYIHELVGKGSVLQRQIGMAKLCFLKEYRDFYQKKAKKRRRMGKKSEVGQSQILTAFLVLMLIPTLIIAQNVTNMTSHVIEGGIETTVDPQLNLTDTSIFSTTSTLPWSGNLTTSTMTTTLESIFSTSSVFTTTLETSILENISTTVNMSTTIIPATTSTILTTIPDNITIPENETSTTTTVETTTTVNETSTVTTTTIETTLETTTTIEFNVTQPVLNIELDLPEKVTRGEVFNVTATITNDGTADAKNVILDWEIPEKFEILSGDLTKDYGTIPVGLFCSAELTVATSVDTELGNNLVKAVVSYES